MRRLVQHADAVRRHLTIGFVRARDDILAIGHVDLIREPARLQAQPRVTGIGRPVPPSHAVEIIPGIKLQAALIGRDGHATPARGIVDARDFMHGPLAAVLRNGIGLAQHVTVIEPARDRKLLMRPIEPRADRRGLPEVERTPDNRSFPDRDQRRVDLEKRIGIDRQHPSPARTIERDLFLRPEAGKIRHAHYTGARTLGQDESSSIVYGMPRAAFELGAVERQLPLRKLAAEILKLCNAEQRESA